MENTKKQLHVWVEREVYEKARRLIGFGVYKSFSELVRDGLELVLVKEAGYERSVEDEANKRFSENQMNETRIKIDGMVVKMRVNARWWHVNANSQLLNLIEDLHIPGPIEDIEEKYGTKIQLCQLGENFPE